MDVAKIKKELIEQKKVNLKEIYIIFLKFLFPIILIKLKEAS